MLRKLFYALPLPLKYAARWCYYWPIDALNWLKGNQHPMVPPVRMCFTGSGDFIRIGQYYLELFRQYGGLKSHHNVLDIGSELGRMALPLTDFLLPTATYDGVDVVPKGVDWCNKHIGAKYPNFKFHHAYLHNSLYTSTKADDASTYRFGFGDATFDFVWLTSVFTHMLPAEMAQYLAEISRMLKPGGKCLFTMFMVPDHQPNRRIQNAGFNFSYPYGPNTWLMDSKTPHANVAFGQQWLLTQLALHGLVITHQLLGYWHTSNAADGIEFQDIIVVEKT